MLHGVLFWLEFCKRIRRMTYCALLPCVIWSSGFGLNNIAKGRAQLNPKPFKHSLEAVRAEVHHYGLWSRPGVGFRDGNSGRSQKASYGTLYFPE